MDVNEKWAALQTMTQEKWNKLRPAERDALRSDGGLTKQLIGCEGWRVEVEDYMTGEKRRFIVSRSTGWIPCHIELKNRMSTCGDSANREYRSVRKLYYARHASQLISK
jgi:hypothetical protein